ncbi:exodeoxyribonuclease VII large subunit [Sinobaca qinghaiensis]|uniref:Exodeoxyribonuclease 7 large subunit n=2 Tax=Sinobaca qinghaiensis TaxID=342944 RepID=A0A419V382_9BACL|nr:exodeoxyribonuclease VII large subunit [Sinobaca qinghaiensis]
MTAMEDRWISISQLTSRIKQTIEQNVDLQAVWLRGEISNFKKHSRGHMYFTIKDERSKISAVMFAGNNKSLAFEPENGMKVLIRGRVSVYEPFGQYQLYVNDMEPDGIGQLFIKYEQLKNKLELEGLFREGMKKKLPAYPKKIAVITSPTGAAIRDVISTIKRRYPPAGITLYPVLVQGRDAAPSIVRALKQAETDPEVDVIIAGRGGGSIEELWAFNEEIVARAIHAASIPIISAVGHETDFTIADFAADVRAATPTAAAEIAVPSLIDVVQQITSYEQRLHLAMDNHRKRGAERLKRLQGAYAFRYPMQLLQQKEQELDRLMDRLEKRRLLLLEGSLSSFQVLKKRLELQHPQRKLESSRKDYYQTAERLEKVKNRYLQNKQNDFYHVLQKLNLLNPLQILERGYQVSFDEKGELISSVKQAVPGSRLDVQMKDGTVQTKVIETVSKRKWDFEKKEGENDE